MSETVDSNTTETINVADSAAEKVATVKTANIAKYSKEQILKSKQFKPIEKDFLGSLLEDNKKYSLDEAKNLIGEFLKQEV